DREEFPTFRATARLGDLRQERLRRFFREELQHASYERRTQAVTAIGKLGPTPVDTTTLRRMVNDRQPYSVVRAALTVLALWDPVATRDVVQAATRMTSPHSSLKALAHDLLQRRGPVAPADQE